MGRSKRSTRSHGAVGKENIRAPYNLRKLPARIANGCRTKESFVVGSERVTRSSLRSNDEQFPLVSQQCRSCSLPTVDAREVPAAWSQHVLTACPPSVGKNQLPPATFSDLPNEILVEIFLKLDSVTRKRVERVDRRWRAVIRETLILKKTIKIDLHVIHAEREYKSLRWTRADNFLMRIAKEYRGGPGQKSPVESVIITGESNPERGSLTEFGDQFFSSISEMYFKYHRDQLFTQPVRLTFIRVLLPFPELRWCGGMAKGGMAKGDMDFVSRLRLIDVTLERVVFFPLWGKMPSRDVEIQDRYLDITEAGAVNQQQLWALVNDNSAPLSVGQQRQLTDWFNRARLPRKEWDQIVRVHKGNFCKETTRFDLPVGNLVHLYVENLSAVIQHELFLACTAFYPGKSGDE